MTDEVEALKAILLDHELHIKENRKCDILRQFIPTYRLRFTLNLKLETDLLVPKARFYQFLFFLSPLLALTTHNYLILSFVSHALFQFCLNIVLHFRGEPECIETIVFPSTGEDSQSQYVCVRLVVHLPPGYPDISPKVTLRNPRGLHEDTVRLIQSDAEAKCQDFIGQPVMFELIEVRFRGQDSSKYLIYPKRDVFLAIAMRRREFNLVAP